jgi:hypothetical protein
MTQSIRCKYAQPTILRAAVLAAFCIVGVAPAQAQITRGFIGPHEYSLPDPKGMKPWNVFVEYSTLQFTDKVWNSSGDKVGVGKTEVLVSLSKFVHFWEVTPGVGIAMELIVPKVGIRDKGGLGAGSASGIADPIVGPAFWIKPAPNWTLGMDMFFLQIPMGDSDVGGGKRWNAIASVFWDGQFDKINWTGNIGTTIFGKGDDGSRLGPSVYVNNRLGFRASQLIEPYVGIDYERQQAKSGNPSNHEWGGALGVMFHMMPHSHIAVHYQKGFKGGNRSVSDNLNLRFAYVF